jgi:ABC-type bacteriocin/lantibiotic exporter with double-glycine peptidase domain
MLAVMSQILGNKRNRIRAILESEPNESGAISLGILLAFYGRHLSLTQLKNDCGVTRDGTTVPKVAAAAELNGLLRLKQASVELEALQRLDKQGHLPAIILGAHNRFSVLVRCQRDQLEVFDTARGFLQLRPSELFIEEVLLFAPGPEFEIAGHPASAWAMLKRLFLPLKSELLLLVLIATASLIPLLTIAGSTSQFIDAFLQEQRFSFGIPIAWLLLIAVCLSLLLTLFRDLLIRRLEYVLTRSFAATVYESCFSADFPYYLQRSSSELAMRMAFASKIPNLIISQLGTALLQLWTGVLVIAFSSLISPVLFVLLIASFAIVLGFNVLVTKSLSINNDALTAEGNQALSLGIQGIGNIESIKSSGLEFEFLRDWQAHYVEGLRQKLIISRQMIRSVVLVNGSIFAITFGLLGVGGIMIIKGSLSLGSLLAFLFLQSQINNALIQTPSITRNWQLADGMLRRLNDVFSAPRDPLLRAFERRPSIPHEEAKLVGTIDMQDVCYSFSPVDPPYISGLQIHLKPGQHLALVGSSGSGKSTIIRMMAGFYRPCSGDYRIGGRSWLEIPDSTIRASLAYVPQDVFIFNASFEENIKLWRPGYTQAEVLAAAKAADLHDDIMNFSDAYDAVLADDGTNISGGQRQRIEIARALLKNPSILLLDEATSALDNRSEAHVLRAVRARGITVVTVAHRLNAALQSDVVLVLDQGKVVEMGHPDELLAHKAAFHRLVTAEARLQG